MSKHTDTRRGRSRLVALLAMMATLLTVVAVSLGSGPARADTTATTDTNTRAVLDPATAASNCNPTPPAQAAAPCATSTNGAAPQSPADTGTPVVLAGAAGGDFVSIHIDTNGAGGTLSGVSRTALCRGSLTDVQLSAQMLPSNGDCIPGGGLANGEPGNGNHLAGASSPPNTYLDYTFQVGSGTYTPTTGTPITCDVNNPCNLWIQESVTNSSDGSGFVFKHYLVTYTGTPGAPGVTVTPGINKLTVDVSPPSNNGNTSQPLSYAVTVGGGDCPTPAGCGTQNGTGTHYTFQPLTAVQTYNVSATATSTGANGTSTFTGPAGTGTGTPVAQPSSALTQTIYASRPNGALVLTQVCTGYPNGSTGTPPATSPGFPGQAAGAPTFNGGPDPLYGQYPYPTAADGTPDPNYPTNCNVDLGVARVLSTGSHAGQVFEATGAISQVTVVDTRDTDPGWNATGTMGTFQNTGLTGARTSFGGGDLGWTPHVTSTSPTYTDTSGTTYTQTVSAGSAVAPNTPDGAGCAGTTPANFACAGGLGSGALLAKGTTGSGLGIAKLDATLDLFIPIYARSGEYSGVLTIGAV